MATTTNLKLYQIMNASDKDRVLYRVTVNHEIALPLNQALEYIDEINFEMLIEKITQLSPDAFRVWSKDAAIEVVNYYKNYLKLLRLHGSNYDFLPPSIEIDEIWHHHILDTYKYQYDCHKIFGQFLHHYPYFGMRSTDDFENLCTFFNITKKLYEAEFGEELMSFEYNIP